MARQFLFHGNHGDTRANEAIRRLCLRATQIDPGYARAWALLALAETSRHFVGGKPGDGLEAAEKALSLDPDLAEARAVRARHLFRLGRQDEAAVEIAIALAMDPESYEVNATAGQLNYRKRDFAAAARSFEKAAALVETAFGDAGMLLGCYSALGDNDGRVRAAKMTLERVQRTLEKDPSNGSAISFGVSALAVLGEGERARDWMSRGLAIDPDNMIMRYNFGCSLSLQLNDIDGALEMLGPYCETAVAGDLAFVKIDPELDPIRADPRFVAILNAFEARVSADNRGPTGDVQGGGA